MLNDSVGKNMQDDAVAFEGWALTLKRWAKYDKVILSWDKKLYPNTDTRYGHYQRFLFRVTNFAADFKSWFSVKPSCIPYLTDLDIKVKGTYYLSSPKKSRSIIKPKGKEGILEFEYSFGKWLSDLKNATNASFLDRQLPMGVFRVKVSEPTAIFSRGKSAIDIWGINKNNELLIFELKAEGNNKIGIITELYFYCCVMQRVQKGQFKYEKVVPPIDKIAKTNKIKAYYFAPELHPLIDRTLVDYINAGTTPDVEFHYLKFPKEGGSSIYNVF